MVADTMVIMGAALVTIGAGLAWLPLGFIVGGLCLIYAGINLAGSD